VVPRQQVAKTRRQGSRPTGEPARRETRDRPSARHDRSCGDPRNLDKTRDPCRRTGPVDRAGTPDNGTARTLPPGTRTSGSRETLVQRNAAAPVRRAGAPPARGMSRSGRAPIGGGHPARVDAVDRWRRHSPLRPRAHGACPTVDACHLNELRGKRMASIAETAIGRAVARRRFCHAARSSRTGVTALVRPSSRWVRERALC